MSEIQKHDHLLIETPPEVIGFAAIRSFGAGFRVLPRNRENHAELLERQWRAIWAKHDDEESKVSLLLLYLQKKESMFILKAHLITI